MAFFKVINLTQCKRMAIALSSLNFDKLAKPHSFDLLLFFSFGCQLGTRQYLGLANLGPYFLPSTYWIVLAAHFMPIVAPTCFLIQYVNRNYDAFFFFLFCTPTRGR